MTLKYKLLTGMRDILPEDSIYWRQFEDILIKWIHSYAYQEIRTPILEQTDLFIRSIGEETDVIGKEMYQFTDLSEELISLRPEGTASTLRAVIENNYLYNGPKKLWYMGPMFRREKPQKGRYRQFHQFGVEALGFEGPDIDIEILSMTYQLWKQLDLLDFVTLEINTLGKKEERAEYKKSLIDYFNQYKSELDEDSKRRLNSNPLRILDTKNPNLQEICNNAPKLFDFLGENSLSYYTECKEILTQLGIPYRENKRLVRGLDYYNHTVFEWVTTALGAQGTICAGGRYNGLIQELGGKDYPGIGFAIGVERVLLLVKQNGQHNDNIDLDIYLINQGREAFVLSMKYAEQLRQLGKSVQVHLGGQKIQTQFKKANISGAKFALIVGENEVTNNEITLKDLRGNLGQITFSSSELENFINQWMV